MQNISLEALDTVTGGTTPSNTGSSSSSSSSSGNCDQLLTAVQGIQSSLKDLKNDNNKGLFGGPNGALTFMCLAMCMQRRNDSTVVVNGGGGYHGYYSFRAGW